MDDDIHSDHGYLGTWDIPAGPPFKTMCGTVRGKKCIISHLMLVFGNGTSNCRKNLVICTYCQKSLSYPVSHSYSQA